RRRLASELRCGRDGERALRHRRPPSRERGMTPRRDHEGTVSVEHRDAIPVLSIRENAAIDVLASAQGERLRELWHSFRSRGLRRAGPPFVRYRTLGERETDMEVGVPAGEGATGEGRIRAGELPGGPVITTWHLGAHDSLGEAYGRLAAWLSEHEREAAGPAWE